MNAPTGSRHLDAEPPTDQRQALVSPADNDASGQLMEAIQEAIRDRKALAIYGGNNKAFYGRRTDSTPISAAGHTGILSYDPTELVLTARAGTPLALIESVLAEHLQVIPFEPPNFGPTATLGGAIACGLSGPRRPFVGAARDFVLGVTVLTGRGQRLRFGGQVMKNVAGYDIARLMTGSLGTLGVLLDISVKVLPAPHTEITLALERDAETAIQTMNALAARPLPLSAACAYGGILYLRLSGTPSAITTARETIGGTTVDGSSLWQGIREHTHPFFAGPRPLWRLSVPSATPVIDDLPGALLVDWGGAQRWLRTDAHAPVIREAVDRVGGHATFFRGHDGRDEVFHPLKTGLLRLHRRLKEAFDPQRILNPGRMYEEL